MAPAIHPTDRAALVRSVLGTPWVAGGSDPRGGWDCWGLCAWLSPRLYGQPLPAFGALYAAPDAFRPEAVAALIAPRLADFAACAPGPGAVAVLRILGEVCHVGLCLEDRRMVHVLPGARTVIADLDLRPWRDRLVGCWRVPTGEGAR